jgi:hypothetical protein
MSAVLLVVAIILFVVATLGHGIGDLAPIELAYLGLACWATAVLIGVAAPYVERVRR